MEKKLTVGSMLSNGFSIGLKNALVLLGAMIVWLLTCWIPYLNVGTTIGLGALAIDLAKGKKVNPIDIFDEKYRKIMGKFFMLYGLMFIVLLPAFLFLIVPGIVIALSYSIAFYLMVDKDMEPSKSISESVRLTDGYKGTIFLASLVLGLISAVVSFIFSGISGGSWWGVLLNLIVTLLISVVSVGMSAYMYRKLADIEVVEEQPAQM